MKFYVHPINPHYAATHADVFRAGWPYGIWEHPYPAREPGAYQFHSRTLEAAQDLRAQAEHGTAHLAGEPVPQSWMRLPEAVEAHSSTAAEFIESALDKGHPIQWPWTEVSGQPS
jgi:hypothetical protein